MFLKGSSVVSFTWRKKENEEKKRSTERRETISMKIKMFDF